MYLDQSVYMQAFDTKIKLLRLTPALKSTSSSYNQFSLGFKDSINQTLCSLHEPNEVIIDKKIEVFHGNGSILKLIKIIKQLIDKNNYDLVHIHNGLTGVAFLLAIFPFKLFLLKKTIFTLHNSWNVIKPINQFLNLIIMIVCRKICICSKSSKESIPKIIAFFLNNKSQTIVNGFDHQRIDNVEIKKIDNIHFDKKSIIKIVYVGVLNNVKNQIALLEVLKTTEINSEIIFIGDGKNKAALIDFSKDIPNYVKIRFKGLVSREVTIEHMLEADISISLSKGEGMPIAALESMYSGCYLILSNIPPHLELTLPLDRHYLIELSNKAQIRDSLLYVEKNIEEIKSNRKKSKDHAISNFSIKKMLQLYTDVYQDVYKQNK